VGCFQSNNKACPSGQRECTQQECNTPGDDESMIQIICRPESSPSSTVSVTTRAGSRNTARCPDGYVIDHGFAIQLSDNYANSEQVGCFQSNNKACPSGQRECTQQECNTPGDDESMIHIICTYLLSPPRQLRSDEEDWYWDNYNGYWLGPTCEQLGVSSADECGEKCFLDYNLHGCLDLEQG